MNRRKFLKAFCFGAGAVFLKVPGMIIGKLPETPAARAAAGIPDSVAQSDRIVVVGIDGEVLGEQAIAPGLDGEFTIDAEGRLVVPGIVTDAKKDGYADHVSLMLGDEVIASTTFANYGQKIKKKDSLSVSEFTISFDRQGGF